MSGWLKSLLGGKSKPAPKKALAKKSPSFNREALLAEAMNILKREQAQAQSVLEKALAEAKANPPKPSDIAGMTRLLNLRAAVLNMRANAGPPKKPPPGKPKR